MVLSKRLESSFSNSVGVREVRKTRLGPEPELGHVLYIHDGIRNVAKHILSYLSEDLIDTSHSRFLDENTFSNDLEALQKAVVITCSGLVEIGILVASIKTKFLVLFPSILSDNHQCQPCNHFRFFFSLYLLNFPFGPSIKTAITLVTSYRKNS